MQIIQRVEDVIQRIDSNVGAATTKLGITAGSNYQVVVLTNTHATQLLYVDVIKRGTSAPTISTSVYMKVLAAAGGSVELSFGPGIDIYIYGSGAATTYTARVFA